jgi:hypothetical protein
MEITRKEIEKILGYEVANYKILKRSYRGRRTSTLTLSIQPKKEPEYVTVTIKLNK